MVHYIRGVSYAAYGQMPVIKIGDISLHFAAKLNLEYRELRSGLDSRSSGPDGLLIMLFSKLVCAEVSKITGATKRVFHQTVNAQNSMLTKEIHDQG